VDVSGHPTTEAAHGRRHLANPSPGEGCEPIRTRFLDLAADRRGHVADLPHNAMRYLLHDRRHSLNPTPDVRLADASSALSDRRRADPRRNVAREPMDLLRDAAGVA
jgi:hypothetical protein